jgi:hypothetical protein
VVQELEQELVPEQELVQVEVQEQVSAEELKQGN